jgi:hypothetical protein
MTDALSDAEINDIYTACFEMLQVARIPQKSAQEPSRKRREAPRLGDKIPDEIQSLYATVVATSLAKKTFCWTYEDLKSVARRIDVLNQREDPSTPSSSEEEDQLTTEGQQRRPLGTMMGRFEKGNDPLSHERVRREGLFGIRQSFPPSRAIRASSTDPTGVGLDWIPIPISFLIAWNDENSPKKQWRKRYGIKHRKGTAEKPPKRTPRFEELARVAHKLDDLLVKEVYKRLLRGDLTTECYFTRVGALGFLRWAIQGGAEYLDVWTYQATWLGSMVEDILMRIQDGDLKRFRLYVVVQPDEKVLTMIRGHLEKLKRSAAFKCNRIRHGLMLPPRRVIYMDGMDGNTGFVFSYKYELPRGRGGYELYWSGPPTESEAKFIRKLASLSHPVH